MENPQLNNEKEIVIDQAIVDNVRQTLIKELKDAVITYRPNWVNRESCLEIIHKLENKLPLKIGGPFYGDYMSSIIEDIDKDKRLANMYKRKDILEKMNPTGDLSLTTPPDHNLQIQLRDIEEQITLDEKRRREIWRKIENGE